MRRFIDDKNRGISLKLFANIVPHKNNAPINATTGLIEVDPRSSLNKSVIHCLKFIPVVFSVF